MSITFNIQRNKPGSTNKPVLESEKETLGSETIYREKTCKMYASQVVSI